MTSGPITRSEACDLDAEDPLTALRDEFALPARSDGRPCAYFAGNSLGPMPRATRGRVESVLAHWEEHGVGGHFTEPDAWYRYDEVISARQGAIVGALPHEVALMSSLTVDLHLLMASFHRPTPSRRKILIEPHAFPSDRYAVQSRIEMDGGDPARDVVIIETSDPDRVTIDDLATTLERHGDEIATALIGGVNYYTGQFLDLGPMTAMLAASGIVVGLDLAHAAGNVMLELHDWNVDFASWCTYKYLNGGPGSTGGFFVHERHGLDPATPRLAGWWGNDPEARFDMHAQEEFVARPGADGWKISNPSILAMAPLGASFEIFDRVGMAALRERSERLTATLEQCLIARDDIEIITPDDPERRGAQLSVRVPSDAAVIEKRLASLGVIVDARDPDIIRVAPTPLTTSFCDVVELVEALDSVLG